MSDKHEVNVAVRKRALELIHHAIQDRELHNENYVFVSMNIQHHSNLRNAVETIAKSYHDRNSRDGLVVEAISHSAIVNDHHKNVRGDALAIQVKAGPVRDRFAQHISAELAKLDPEHNGPKPLRKGFPSLEPNGFGRGK